MRLLRRSTSGGTPAGLRRVVSDRDAELLQEAKARLNSQPDRYTTVYGDNIVGGTSWIYLTDTAPEELGFPKGLSNEPLPKLTWNVIAKLPFVVIGVGL